MLEAPQPAGVSWGRVDERADRVLIVACGPSAAAVPAEQFRQAAAAGVYVLAVNGSVAWLPLEHGWMTVDPSPANRRIMAGRWPGVTYYAAVPDDYGTPRAGVAFHRPPAERGIVYLRRVAGVGRWKQMPTLSEDPRRIHTGNSAWGALGVAYLMGARRIGILGLDATDEPYAFSGSRPKYDFRHLPALFESALPQLRARGVRVLNGSPGSRVGAFDRSPASAMMRWISEGANGPTT